MAADVLESVALVNRLRAKPILVMTDLFTKYGVVTSAQEIVENWMLKFGATNVLAAVESGKELLKLSHSENVPTTRD